MRVFWVYKRALSALCTYAHAPRQREKMQTSAPTRPLIYTPAVFSSSSSEESLLLNTALHCIAAHQTAPHTASPDLSLFSHTQHLLTQPCEHHSAPGSHISCKHACVSHCDYPPTWDYPRRTRRGPGPGPDDSPSVSIRLRPRSSDDARAKSFHDSIARHR